MPVIIDRSSSGKPHIRRGASGSTAILRPTAGPGSPGPVVASWTPSTAYTANQIIRNPSNELVMAKAAFTSGTTYDATKWDFVPASAQVKRINITTSAPTNLGTAGVLEIPDTSWLETHDHLDKQPGYSIKLRSGNYVHPWHSAPSTTLPLGAFSGALYMRLNMAPFFWPDDATIQSFHAEITTVGTGVVRFGIYDHDFVAGSPGATFIDLGTIDSTVLGIQAIVNTFTLARGWKWLAWCWQGTSTTGPTIRARTPDNATAAITGASSTLDLTNRRAGMYPSITVPAGGLPPGPFTLLNGNDANVPSVALRRS